MSERERIEVWECDCGILNDVVDEECIVCEQPRQTIITPPKGEPDIFDTQPTCGELSCDECNERYAKALARISALEAERDKAVELLRTECLCYEFSAACSRCKQKHVFLASIGGEGQAKPTEEEICPICSGVIEEDECECTDD